MDNQHRKIAGYRELSLVEITLINRIKAKGKELLDLHAELVESLQERQDDLQLRHANGETDLAKELVRLEIAEPLRWAAIGKTDIQTGIMALVRAVAQPSDC